MLTLNIIDVIWQSAAPIGLGNIGWKLCLTLSVSTTIAYFIVPLKFPETRNKPLEEIPRLFGGDNQLINPQIYDERSEKTTRKRVSLVGNYVDREIG